MSVQHRQDEGALGTGAQLPAQRTDPEPTSPAVSHDSAAAPAGWPAPANPYAPPTGPSRSTDDGDPGQGRQPDGFDRAPATSAPDGVPDQDRSTAPGRTGPLTISGESGGTRPTMAFPSASRAAPAPATLPDIDAILAPPPFRDDTPFDAFGAANRADNPSPNGSGSGSPDGFTSPNGTSAGGIPLSERPTIVQPAVPAAAEPPAAPPPSRRAGRHSANDQVLSVQPATAGTRGGTGGAALDDAPTSVLPTAVLPIHSTPTTSTPTSDGRNTGTRAVGTPAAGALTGAGGTPVGGKPAGYTAHDETLVLPAFVTGKPEPEPAPAEPVRHGTEPTLPASERGMLIFVASLLGVGTIAVVTFIGVDQLAKPAVVVPAPSSSASALSSPSPAVEPSPSPSLASASPTRASPTARKTASPTPTVKASTSLGTLTKNDPSAYCLTTKASAAHQPDRTDPSWSCGADNHRTNFAPTDVCQWKYDDNTAYAVVGSLNDPSTWRCYT